LIRRFRYGQVIRVLSIPALQAAVVAGGGCKSSNRFGARRCWPTATRSGGPSPSVSPPTSQTRPSALRNVTCGWSRGAAERSSSAGLVVEVVRFRAGVCGRHRCSTTGQAPAGSAERRPWRGLSVDLCRGGGWIRPFHISPWLMSSSPLSCSSSPFLNFSALFSLGFTFFPPLCRRGRDVKRAVVAG